MVTLRLSFIWLIIVLYFLSQNLVFRQGGHDFRKVGLDFMQRGLNLQQFGLDFWQVGKITKSALAVALKAEANQDLEPRSKTCLDGIS